MNRWLIWSSDVNRWLTGKVPDAGKDRGQKEKRMSEDEMAGRHTDTMNMNLGKLQEMVRGREAWRAAVCKESDTAGRLKNNNKKIIFHTWASTNTILAIILQF